MSPATTELRGDPRSAAPQAPSGHLHEVDVVRLLTFASVILVHSLSATTDGLGTASGAVAILIHFTRETFFVLSAFVLFHVHYARGLRARRFWRKRASTILAPYLLWTAIYWATKLHAAPWRTASLERLVHDAWSGEAKFHLYFLLVSMQLYAVLPLLVLLVRVTAGHHRALVAAATAWQLAVLSLLHWWTELHVPTSGAWGQVRAYADTMLPTYLGYVLVGAVAAVHLARGHAWVVEHTRTVVALLAVGAVVGLVCYAQGLAEGFSPDHASQPLQPALVPLTAVITLGLYALGAAYARRRRAGGLPRLGAVVATGSTISFGVYLVHPLVLQYAVPLLDLGPSSAWAPLPVAVAVAWCLAAAVSTAVVLLVVRTPLSLPLTGRHQQRRREAAAPTDRSSPPRPTRAPGAVTS